MPCSANCNSSTIFYYLKWKYVGWQVKSGGDYYEKNHYSQFQSDDICRIEKPLTFHIARHTFATTVTLTNGAPIETVSKLLGHTSIKTTQIYAKAIEKKVSEDMKSLRDILQNEGYPLDSNDIMHLSPARFAHINRLGKYTFELDKNMMNGGLRKLRDIP